MDPRIENLKSTTFFGKRLTRRQIADIQETVALFPGLSRRELSNTICEHLGWFTPKGGYRVQSCLGMLEQLEALGILSLPETRVSMQRGSRKKPVWTHRSDPVPTIGDDLKRLTPLVLQVVTEKDAVEEWNELVERHHYLGSRRPFGRHLRYVILDNRRRKLGCLMFEAATTALPCRDQWIGWREQDRAKRPNLVVNNSRFMIFPWVKVKFLASKALSVALRQLAGDWEAQYGFRPVLAETFVDLVKFEATCYRAANWQKIGMTKGRKASAAVEGKTQKGVYVFPLARNCRSTLLNGPRPAKRRCRPPSPSFTPDDPFVQLWSGIIGTAVAVANDHDRVWQQRRRVLNSLLIMLFIFRLVFSKSRQGYAITLAELWDQCRTLGIELPQPTPVSASAMCNARAKLDENAFKVLHAGILEQVSETRGATEGRAGKLWRGHRVFAVDGSKMNLPRPLIAEGYRTPSDSAHYPQGLVSCLYQLRLKLPVDFDLHAHGNEREAALAHLEVLSENDVVVYDRGYWSFEMLHAHAARGLHPVFRIKRKAGGTFDAFINSQWTDAVVEVAPGSKALRKLRRKHPGGTFGPHRLRLVKYTAGGTVFILGTTLLDREKYRIEDLSNLYHGRWGIEELYKISKQLMGVDNFHGQSERGVKQELYAHFVLIALTRLFTNRGEAGINACLADNGKMQANFKNSLAVVARNIEDLLLKQAAVLSETVTRIVAGIATCRQRLRPNRSYERRSRKPVGKWQCGTASKAANAIAAG